MRYILDVSGNELKLIRASIVNFQRTLELSDQAEFDNIIDDLDQIFFKISRIKKGFLKYVKGKSKWHDQAMDEGWKNGWTPNPDSIVEKKKN